MSIWNDIGKPLNIKVMMRQNGFYTSKDQLIEDLEFAASTLKTLNSLDKNKVYYFAEHFEKTIKILKLRDTIVKNYNSGKKIAEAISILKRMGSSLDNQQAAAQAYGKLFSGIGELAEYLPPPINSYLAIFADAEDFFENIRVQADPKIHIRGDNLKALRDEGVL